MAVLIWNIYKMWLLYWIVPMTSLKELTLHVHMPFLYEGIYHLLIWSPLFCTGSNIFQAILFRHRWIIFSSLKRTQMTALYSSAMHPSQPTNQHISPMLFYFKVFPPCFQWCYSKIGILLIYILMAAQIQASKGHTPAFLKSA